MNKMALARKIAERDILGRPLDRDEQLRFLDGDRNNLSVDNILVLPKSEGSKFLFYCPACESVKLLERQDILVAGHSRAHKGRSVCRGCHDAEEEKCRGVFHGAWECPNCGLMQTAWTRRYAPPLTRPGAMDPARAYRQPGSHLPPSPLCTECARELASGSRMNWKQWAATQCNWDNWRDKFREMADYQTELRLFEEEQERQRRGRAASQRVDAVVEIGRAYWQNRDGREVDYVRLTKVLLRIDDVAFEVLSGLFFRRGDCNGDDDEEGDVAEAVRPGAGNGPRRKGDHL